MDKESTGYYFFTALFALSSTDPFADIYEATPDSSHIDLPDNDSEIEMN